jgi:hypothetical protein
VIGFLHCPPSPGPRSVAGAAHSLGAYEEALGLVTSSPSPSLSHIWGLSCHFVNKLVPVGKAGEGVLCKYLLNSRYTGSFLEPVPQWRSTQPCPCRVQLMHM